MRNFILGLLALSSLSAFAQTNGYATKVQKIIKLVSVDMSNVMTYQDPIEAHDENGAAHTIYCNQNSNLALNYLSSTSARWYMGYDKSIDCKDLLKNVSKTRPMELLIENSDEIKTWAGVIKTITNH